MDHSLRGYLERRNNRELLGILRELRKNGAEHWDAEVVLMIMEILKKRMAEGEDLRDYSNGV